jgi:hypothetical protein
LFYSFVPSNCETVGTEATDGFRVGLQKLKFTDKSHGWQKLIQIKNAVSEELCACDYG